VEKGTLMAIPAMLAFDMDQTSGAEVGAYFFKSNFNRRGRLLAILASALSLSITVLAEDSDPPSGGQPGVGGRGGFGLLVMVQCLPATPPLCRRLPVGLASGGAAVIPICVVQRLSERTRADEGK
jgi:hypothetical protein